MGGYRRYQTELLRSFVPSFVIPFLKQAARLTGVRNDTALRALNSIGETDDVRRFEATYSVFDRTQISRLIGHDSTRATERIRYYFDLLRCSSQPRSAQRMMSLDLRMNLADDLLLYTDKITMHHSIECRVPLLDLDLVRFVESLPCSYRMGVLRGKILHRRFAKQVLPASVVNRKKNGFRTPAGSWFKQTGLIGELLLDTKSRFASYFNLAEVETILKEHAAGMNRVRHIFLLLTLYYWIAECLAPEPGRIPAEMQS
jgi:asparagine synthase (glutamine-hydrolysing)